MKKEVIRTENRACIIYHSDNAKALLIQPVDDRDIEVLDGEVSCITEKIGESFILAAFKINDWNSELSPWQAPPVFGKEGFGNGAKQTLGSIENTLIPLLSEKYALPENIPTIMGGYSLAALFSLWAAYNSNKFAAVMAASPSVWFPNWIDYAKNNTPRTSHIYLSLGNKEEKTKNQTMARVGECIRKQYDLLCEQGIDSIYEQNEGNHFTEPDKRCAKGFVWCVTR